MLLFGFPYMQNLILDQSSFSCGFYATNSFVTVLLE